MPRSTNPRPSSAPGKRARNRSNPKSKSRSLNALSIAQSTTTDKPTLPKHRLGQAPSNSRSKNQKVRNVANSDDEDGEDDAPSRRGGDVDSEVEGGSDSDGGHWRVGVGSDDDESDIDSDEAMGESDEERFADFAFRGSTGTGRKKKVGTRKEVNLDESDGGSGSEEESEGEGEGFVDLSEMLDRNSDESEPENGKKGKAEVKSKGKGKKRPAPESESESESEDEDDDDDGLDLDENSDDSSEEEPSDGGESDADSFAHFSEEEDAPEDPEKLAALQDAISSLPTGSRPSKRPRLDDPNEGKTPGEYNLSITSDSGKLSLSDLIPTINDPTIKKSLKTLTDTAPAGTKSTGVQGKLSAPLAKRQQDRIDRAAAYVKTTETLGRWVDTVKMNREADHISFPLANAPNAPIKAPARLLSLTASSHSTPMTALEATISSILKDSNMESEKQIAEFEELKTNKLSIDEVQKRTAELRMARELLYREELKAKRIKKIKSKSYHRVHKKERQRAEAAIEEALALERGGVPDAEEELERERKRAEERMTLRHKQSKWAKGLKESGRTIWDDEAQDGAIEMARRAEELTRRIKGKDVRSDGNELSDSSSEEDNDDDFDEEGVELRKKLMKDIEKAEASLGDSSKSKLGSRLMNMKFMQNAEAARKKENEAQLEELKNSLLDDDERERAASSEEEEDEPQKTGSGRMSFKPGKKEKTAPAPRTDKSEFEERDMSEQEEEQNDEEEEEEEDEEVMFVNKATASTSAPVKNPFTAPKTISSTFSGKHTTFNTTKTSTDAPAAAANPWLPQETTQVKPKQLTLTDTKTESKSERAAKKLAKSKKAALADPAATTEVEIDTTVTLKLAPKKIADPDDEGDEVDDKDIHLIPANGKAAKSQRELVRRAFAGDDVVADFEAEKRAVEEEEGDKVIDESLPGWGSWTGEGVRKSDKPNRFLKTVKGISKEKRKDAKLKKVIINEKRVKKNLIYQATTLPHMFETKQQYERSLRIPIGPEWTTKASFQDATKPRVLVKKGVVVEPISAPFK